MNKEDFENEANSIIEQKFEFGYVENNAVEYNCREVYYKIVSNIVKTINGIGLKKFIRYDVNEDPYLNESLINFGPSSEMIHLISDTQSANKEEFESDLWSSIQDTIDDRLYTLEEERRASWKGLQRREKQLQKDIDNYRKMVMNDL